MNSGFKFSNGQRVKDVTTGFKGTITSRVDYVTGNNRYGVESLDEKGTPTMPYFDEERLIAIDED